jgi:predicted nucleotidyltransferase
MKSNSIPPGYDRSMPSTRELAIPIPHEEIAAFCRKWGIRKLAFFGSVVRDDFGPESDVDVLVEFLPEHTPGWEFYGSMPEELSRIFGGRKVDLGTFDSIKRRIREGVLSEAVTEYGEA